MILLETDDQTSGTRLLVIEHDPLAARGLREVLKRFPDVTPTFVEDVDLQSGMRRLEEADPDALLLSVGHVTVQAVSFVRSVKERSPDLTLIVISGDDRLPWVSALLKAGANSFLHKGIASTTFDRSLSRCLRGERLAVVPDPSSWLSRIVNMRRQAPNRACPGNSNTS